MKRRLLPTLILSAAWSLLPAALSSPSESAARADGKIQKLNSPDQVPAGLAKSEWASIRAAYEAGRHAFQPVDDGWQARNPGQQWLTTFDQRGFIAEPQSGGWTWGLELQSYGFGEKQQSIGGVPAVKAEGQRLSYRWDDKVEEWFVNDPRGLEHGFTVASRPKQSGSGPLSFLMETRGSLQPKLAEDALGVLFQDSRGSTMLNYTGLKVWDADGKILRSRFEPAGPKGVRLLVDEADAHYPITIDPLAQQAYLKASNTEADDEFGRSVAVSGDTVVIGAPYEDSNATGVNGNQADNSAAFAGAAYVFVRSGTTWTQQAYLKASNTDANDKFGTSVTVSGDTVVVGAPGESSRAAVDGGTQSDNSAPGAGAAYVFRRVGSTWTQQAFLKANNAHEGEFGYSVSLSGDTVLIGSPGEDTDVTGVWHGNAVLDLIPYPQVLDGNGAAYVFTRSGSAWTQQAMLKASILYATFEVGWSVALSGDTAVIGIPHESYATTGVNGAVSGYLAWSGAALVFTRSGSTWSQQAYLKASNTGADDEFGYSVAVSGDTVVVGARQEDSNATGINGDQANDSATYAGAAYVFTRSGGLWSQQAYLKASIADSFDEFGCSVAVTGDIVVIGSYLEDSRSTGIDGNQGTGFASSYSNSGAAYIFKRSGNTWAQHAYVKASNTGASDYFGWAVAASGDTAVIGAPREDSSATGVNGDQLDNTVFSSGAAYIFNDISQSPVPVVSGVFPASGSITGGTNVTIGGAGFTGATDVTFGGIPATNVNVIDSTAITCTTPAHAAGSVSVLVTTAGGSNAANAFFTYVDPAAPTVAAISPSSGSPAGGTSVTITGTNFTGVTGVTIGGVAATNVSLVNGNTITCTTPSGSVGSASVLVTNVAGTNVANTLFTYMVTVEVELSAALDTPGRTYILGGEGNWFGQTGTTHDAVDAAQSGPISHNQETWFETTVTGSGNLSFWWKVSSESGFDYLEFYVDGMLQTGSISGDVDWEQKSYTLGAGSHTLRWRYMKDGSLDSGSDAGWVDEVVWTPDGGSYGSWQSLYFTPAEMADPLISGPGAIPHHDGVPNLLKYALNMNAAGPDSGTMPPGGTSGLPSITQPTSGIFRFEFLRRIGSGLIYAPQKSNNLTDPGSWTALTDTPTIIPIDATWERVIYEEPYDANTTPRCFGRVQVTLQP